MDRHLSLDAPDVLLPNRVVPTRLPSIGDPFASPPVAQVVRCGAVSLSLAPPPFFAFANSSAIAKESLERASRSRSHSRLSRVYTRRFLSPYSFFFFFPWINLSFPAVKTRWLVWRHWLVHPLQLEHLARLCRGRQHHPLFAPRPRLSTLFSSGTGVSTARL